MSQSFVHPDNSTADISDLYSDIFDVVVLGSGYIGFSAALGCVRSGGRVLVVEPGGQLLWESSAALDIEIQGVDNGKAWRAWASGLNGGRGMPADHLDPVEAEILAARQFTDDTERMQALLYATPVAIQENAGDLAAVILATKEGFRRVRARRWVDATESGQLLRLLDPAATPVRKVARSLSRVVVQSEHWSDWDAAFDAYAMANNLEWRRGVRRCERQLVWSDDGASWHTALLGRIRHMREAMGKRRPLVSHSSSMAFPVYSGGAENYQPRAGNVLNLSPVFCAEPLVGIADRFRWASRVVEESFADLSVWEGEELPAISQAEIEVAEQANYDVVVAGAGTAGALAALSAGVSGARTCALEFAPFPGGIGTGGGITSYFYGLSGGRQEDIGKRTTELTRLFYGDSYEEGRNYWHQDAKKIAILSEFDACGVIFCGNALLCGVEKNGQAVTGVVAAVDGRLVRFGARSFVDSTGDGDLCAHAGADFSEGRLGDNRTLAYSVSAFTLDTTVPDLRINIRNFDAGWLDATSARDLSRARLAGLVQYDKQEWSEDKRPLCFAPLLGVRESRHIVTDYTLEMDDLITRREFEDVVGWAGSHADTHSVDFEFEDDETVFFYWVCRLFRYQLRTQLPYRMLLPVGLSNVWIACRASGMSSNVFYGIRMQRDMQRLGEVAGVAAALAAADTGLAREVSMPRVRSLLQPMHQSADAVSEQSLGNPMDKLRHGESGTAIWMIFRNRDKYQKEVRQLLEKSGRTSFYAACILAMWEDGHAETRLLEAINMREDGGLDPSENAGAYGQEIDIPFWLLAVILLRRCGSERCVKTLSELAELPDNILNVRSAIALTLERLVDRSCVDEEAAMSIVTCLARPIADRELTPSHSIARRLRQEDQMILKNHYIEPVREDHSWQLHLVLGRIRVKMGMELHDDALAYLRDDRVFVQQAFTRLTKSAALRVESYARIGG